MASERQHVNEQLDRYGTLMKEAFKHMIALKRWEKAVDGDYERLSKAEKVARGVSLHSMARFRRLLQPDDWNKVKAFTAALNTANLADQEDQIIDDTLHRLGVSRLST